MRCLRVALPVPILVLAVAAGALADPIISVGGGTSWQTWAAPTEGGTRFWDNSSWDGAQQNVGYYVTNPGFAGAPLDYWGTNGGEWDTSFYLQNDSGVQRFILQGGISFYLGVNELGWFEYTPGTAGQPGVMGAQHVLFGGSQGDVVGTTAVFAPTEFYGYYLASGDGQTYTTLNNGGQFALFNDGNSGLWVGFEDLPVYGHTDWDYNDMMIQVAPATPVPEPSSLLLVGAGFFGLGAALRRERWLRRPRGRPRGLSAGG